jgi:vacuolar-type H+-ATPase subunit H
MMQQILDDARSNAQGEADQVKAAGAKDIEAIEVNSGKNQEKAVKMVVDALSKS